VNYFTQNGINGAYKRLGQLHKCLPERSIVMRTLITALALTAILATSAVAKTPRHKEVRIQPNNTVSHNAVRRSPTQINSYCRFDRGETDPDRRIVLQLHRDCRDWELDEAE
jgi:hypothetical protein